MARVDREKRRKGFFGGCAIRRSTPPREHVISPMPKVSLVVPGLPCDLSD